MNPSLPLTCIGNNVMCMKSPIQLIYKNLHVICNLAEFPWSFRFVGGGGEIT